MRSLFFIFLLTVTIKVSAAETLDNSGWRFFRVDTAAPNEAQIISPGFNDSTWTPVTLPHAVRIEPPKTSSDYFQGIVWYRQTITAKSAWRGKQVSLFFGGAMQVANVWVNGQFKLKHEGGYTPFSIDLTDELAKDGKAVVVLKLDNTNQPLIPPGKNKPDIDFCYFGGLYRDVRLRVTDPVHLTDPIAANTVAGGGIFARYENVSETSADVVLSAQVQNDGTQPATTDIRFTLLNADKNKIAGFTTPASLLTAGTNLTFNTTLTVKSPQLWSPDHSYLYTLVTEVLRAGKSVDKQNTRLGIRSVAFNNGGFFLNGQLFVPRGGNRHQDYPWIGNAESDNISYRDIRLVKDEGYNFLRLCHYPQSQAVMDACDELGVMVIVCTPGWQYYNSDPGFLNLARQNIRDMIRWHRNHPSALMWEVTLNETYNHDSLYSECAKIAHEEYPGDQMLTSGDTLASPDPVYLDVPYLVWDSKTGFNPKARWQKAFTREYGDYEYGGQESSSRVSRSYGEQALLLEVWNHQFSHNYNRGRACFCGDSLWAWCDDASAYADTNRPLATWGTVDYWRIPKFSYYFYQSLRDPSFFRSDINSGPMTYIANYWMPPANDSTNKTKVVVYSNCQQVELFLNGISLGRRSPDNGPDAPYGVWHPVAHDAYALNGSNADETKKVAAQIAAHETETKGKKEPFFMFDGGNVRNLEHAPYTFTDISYAPGELKAVGYIGGKVVSTFIRRTPDKPVALKLEVVENGRPLAPDGSDAVFIRANVVDANGTIVPDASPDVTFAVDGPARLISPPTLSAEAGIASGLMASADTAGTIHITASAPGLIPAKETYITRK